MQGLRPGRLGPSRWKNCTPGVLTERSCPRPMSSSIPDSPTNREPGNATAKRFPRILPSPRCLFCRLPRLRHFPRLRLPPRLTPCSHRLRRLPRNILDFPPAFHTAINSPRAQPTRGAVGVLVSVWRALFYCYQPADWRHWSPSPVSLFHLPAFSRFVAIKASTGEAWLSAA